MQIQDEYSIPELYTAKNFNEIYNQQILQACQEVLKGNWVLGDKGNSAAISANQFVSQVQTLYLNQYAKAWQELLSHVALKNFQDLNQATEALKIIDNPDSPMWQLLNTINLNTAPNSTAIQFNLLVSPKFQTLNAFLQSPAAANLQSNLLELKKYLEKINHSHDPNKAAFEYTLVRMQNEGQGDALGNLFQQLATLPLPLQSWINSLAMQDWHLLLDASQDYLNEIWKISVLPEYTAHLTYRYPLFRNTKENKEITLKDFTRFFSPGGTLDNFFNFYLKPFVNTEHVYWVWKNVNDAHLNIPQTTLDMFIRASLIQKMYFEQDNNKLHVTFTLAPTALEPGVNAFNLNLEGQMVNYLPNQSQTYNLVWPGDKPNMVSITFTNSQNKQMSMTETGPWAWFKLLDKINLQSTSNPKQYNLTFDLDGNSAKYQLLTNNVVNPFIRGILDVFRCPEKL